MGFILGFLTGLLAAIGIFGFLIYWLCSRSNNIAVAKFINGIAQALAHKRKSPEPSVPGKNDEAMKDSLDRKKDDPDKRKPMPRDARLC